MRRKILSVILAALLLIGSRALAERRLYEIHMNSGTGYDNLGGVAYISDTVTEGIYHVEGRVLLQNVSNEVIGYPNPTLWIYENGENVAKIPASAVTPKATESEGFTLFTYSAIDVKLDKSKQIEIWVSNDAYIVDPKEKYLGVKAGVFEPYQLSDALRMKLDVSELSKGNYSVILIALDQEGRFAWAEKTTVNREQKNEATWGIEDYEVRLLKENDRMPAYMIGAVYKK